MISDRVKTNLKSTFSASLLPKIGLVLLILMVFLSTFAPILATHNPTQTGHFDENGQPYPPLGISYTADVAAGGQIGEVTVESTTEHVLGTNNVGQDVYSRFLYGARISLLVSMLR